ncbi:MAG: glutaredoxin family protein [Burkholderiales bacterium]
MLRLYSRARCGLCDEMAEALRTRGVAFEEVDVDNDPRLVARYGRRVPVLADERGEEICHARLDEAALRSRLGLE